MKTLRTFKWKFFLFPIVAAGAAALILRCANPVDDPPLKWLSKMEFPITNDSFNIAQSLPDMIDIFNDTIVRFWYRRDSLPWYRPSDTFPIRPYINARFFAANTVTYGYASVTWEQNHVYRWDGSAWNDLGEVIDILKGGYDSSHTGIYYLPGQSGDPRVTYIDYIKGDTVVLSLPRADSNAYPVSEDFMEDKYFHPSMGLITISGAPAIQDTFPLSAGTVPPAAYAIPLGSVDLIVFDTISPPLSVTVTNLTGATVSNLDITIFDTTRSASLGPNETVTLSFPTHVWSAGLGSDSGVGIAGGALNMLVGYTSSAATQLEFRVELNGLVATEITAQYSVLRDFRKTFINDYDLTDTLDVKYIDIYDGIFIYLIYNYTGYALETEAEQLHLWSKAVCEARQVDSAQDIEGKFTYYDSCAGAAPCMGYYLGDLTSGYTRVNANDSFRIITSNLAQTRLFPLWNDSLGQSVSRVTYSARIAMPANPVEMINIKSTDSVVFVIRAPNFHFQEMYAVVTKEYVRGGESAVVDVSFPFSRESTQSLRDNFRLSQVLGDIYLIPRLPDSSQFQMRRAFLGEMRVEYSMYNPDYPSVAVNETAVFTNIVNNRLLPLETNITSIMNTWPDSLYITSTIRVPVGTRVRAVNEQKTTDPDYLLYMGRMNIGALTLVRVNMLLGWAIGPDTAKLDLGYGTFKVHDAMKYFNRMENALAYVNLRVYNHTNLYMHLHALVAPEPRMDSLRNMPGDTVRTLIGDTARAHERGYISLLGPRGVRIPARNQRDSSDIMLHKWQIDTVLKYDSCGWRWMASFIPMGADTLRDTDFVFIQSWLHMEGVNNMDSLLIWE